jgi:predicted transcriptional regulator
MALDTDTESQRRIIKTAFISIDVKSTKETMSALSTIVDQYGGFVQSSSTWAQGDSTTAGSVVLRVDADQFEETLENIRGLATVVNSESISGEDVSEEYIDLESRLTNLRAEEKQYLLILGEATTVEDLLMVSDYLSSVRGEIETIEGRLKYLDNQTDLSTITVSVYEEASVIIPTSDWRPIEVAEEAFNRLVVFAQGLVDLLIWVVTFGIPAWVAWAVVRGIWRWWHRRHRGSRK